MKQPPPVKVNPLFILLAWFEATLLVALAIGTIMMISSGEIVIVQVSLMGLAICYFLSAYKPQVQIHSTVEKPGFADLLVASILPKVMWISTAILCMGIAFYTMKNEGYLQMFMIGSFGIISGLALLLYSSLTGVRNLNAAILLRAIPALAIVIFLYFRK